MKKTINKILFFAILLTIASCTNTYESNNNYQLAVFKDSTVLMDGNRHVATMLYDSTQALDSIINRDNE